MASLNKVFLMGNATRDAELKVMSNGQSVVNFGLATSDSWIDKDSGERKEATEFHNIVAYRKTAEICERHVKKGLLIHVEGRLKTRSWEKDGVKHFKTEVEVSKIEFLGKKEEPLKADKSYHSDRLNKDEAPF